MEENTKTDCARGLCVIEGFFEGSSWGHTITTLPVECWPMRTLVFGTHNDGRTERVDAWRDVSNQTNVRAAWFGSRQSLA